MSCRRICRELLWLTRFGEVGPDSAPHLEHLSGCRACRDEVGFDRAMVQRLREALLARVVDASPSDTAWANIVARAQAPDPPRVRVWEWSTALVARLRVATGAAFAGLALVLALNMQIVPAGLAPRTGDGGTADAGPLVGERRPQVFGSASAARDASGAEEAAARLSFPGAIPMPDPFVPPAIGPPATVGPAVEEPAVEEPSPGAAFVLVFDLIEQPEPVIRSGDERPTAPALPPTPRDTEPGAPS